VAARERIGDGHDEIRQDVVQPDRHPYSIRF
jgi:hypothetical protein